MAVTLLRHTRSQRILIGQDSSRHPVKICAICLTNDKTVNHHKKQKTKWRKGSALLLREKNRKCPAAVDVHIRTCCSVTRSQIVWSRTDGRIDGWTDGRMDGWADGWVDGTPGQPLRWSTVANGKVASLPLRLCLNSGSASFKSRVLIEYVSWVP